jgi:hypothetical protein
MMHRIKRSLRVTHRKPDSSSRLLFPRLSTAELGLGLSPRAQNVTHETSSGLSIAAASPLVFPARTGSFVRRTLNLLARLDNHPEFGCRVEGPRLPGAWYREKAVVYRASDRFYRFSILFLFFFFVFFLFCLHGGELIELETDT